MAKARLDFGHGFMKIIIKNQVDRDNYEKEVQAKSTIPPKVSSGSSKTKKPAVQAYVPPVVRRCPDEPSKELLFKLEYEDENHKVFTFSVFCNDDPSLVAKKVSTGRGLSPAMHKALADLIRSEMGKRQAQIR